MGGPFDAIFCRNVMIYFKNDLKALIAAEFYRLLKPQGHLFIGHSETIDTQSLGFKRVSPAVFRKVA